METFEKNLHIGIIQTTVNNDIAWKDRGKTLDHMNPDAECMVVEEIRRGFNDFNSRGVSTPRVVLIPEYSIPHSGIKRVEKFAKAIGAVVIGGCDLFAKEKTAKNRGIIIVPNNWPMLEPALSCSRVYFGKTFFSKTEIDWFNELGLTQNSEAINYIINAGIYGNVGVAICSDFYDIERFVIYKGRIHHLIIIAYNRDNRSFGFLAEAISRLLMCNVIVCNTGHYGDSLAFSPYSAEYRRVIYKSTGAGLFTAQVLEVPVLNLDEEQKRADKLYQGKSQKYQGKKPEFKWAPGYKKL